MKDITNTWDRQIWKKYEESSIVIFNNHKNPGKTLLLHYSLDDKHNISKVLSFKNISSNEVEQGCKEFEMEIIANGI